MSLQSFIHRHYSPAAGESPTGHAIAVVAGLMLLAIGAALVTSIVWVPAGIVIGLVGVFAVIGGVWAHVNSPLNFADLADAVVKLTSAAIAITFALAVAIIIIGFTLTVVVSIFRWIAG